MFHAARSAGLILLLITILHGCSGLDDSMEPDAHETTQQHQGLVIPDEAIHVELWWTSLQGGCDIDLDLHLAHPDAPALPWFDDTFDASEFNTFPNWGSFLPNSGRCEPLLVKNLRYNALRTNSP